MAINYLKRLKEMKKSVKIKMRNKFLKEIRMTKMYTMTEFQGGGGV